MPPETAVEEAQNPAEAVETQAAVADPVVSTSTPDPIMEQLHNHTESAGYGKDVYAYFGGAKQNRETVSQYREQGVPELLELVKASGGTVADVIGLLKGGQDDPNAGHYPEQGVPTGDAQTMARLDAMEKTMAEGSPDKIMERVHDEQQFQQAGQAFQSSLATALDSMGFKAEPKDFQIEGATVQKDQKFDMAQNELVRTAFAIQDNDLKARGLQPGTPQFADAQKQHPTPSQVARAKAIVEPGLKAIFVQQQVAEAEAQASLPGATGGSSGGGRVQKDYENMTQEERYAAIGKRGRARAESGNGL